MKFVRERYNIGITKTNISPRQTKKQTKQKRPSSYFDVMIHILFDGMHTITGHKELHDYDLRLKHHLKTMNGTHIVVEGI